MYEFSWENSIKMKTDPNAGPMGFTVDRWITTPMNRNHINKEKKTWANVLILSMKLMLEWSKTKPTAINKKIINVHYASFSTVVAHFADSGTKLIRIKRTLGTCWIFHPWIHSRAKIKLRSNMWMLLYLIWVVCNFFTVCVFRSEVATHFFFCWEVHVARGLFVWNNAILTEILRIIQQTRLWMASLSFSVHLSANNISITCVSCTRTLFVSTPTSGPYIHGYY